MRVFILEQNEKGELLYPVTNEFGSGSAPFLVLKGSHVARWHTLSSNSMVRVRSGLGKASLLPIY